MGRSKVWNIRMMTQHYQIIELDTILMAPHEAGRRDSLILENRRCVY